MKLVDYKDYFSIIKLSEEKINGILNKLNQLDLELRPEFNTIYTLEEYMYSYDLSPLRLRINSQSASKISNHRRSKHRNIFTDTIKESRDYF